MNRLVAAAPPPAPAVEAVAAPAGAGAAAGTARSAASSNDAGSVRVGIDKIDRLIDLVGELVITQAMLDQFREEFDPSRLSMLQARPGAAGATYAHACRKA